MIQRSRNPVTALIPVKNGEIWIANLEKNLREVLSPFDQVIIIDDNSLDSTLKKLRVLSKKIPNVEIISNKGSGLCDALNLGLKYAENEWIARFDIDDSYRPDRIDKQLAETDENVVAVFSDYHFRGEGGKNLGRVYSPIFFKQTNLSLINSERTAHPSVLFRKTAVINVGSYNRNEFPAEDLGLWLRLAKVGELVTSTEELLFYNLRQKSVSASNRFEIQRITQSLINKDLNLRKLTVDALNNFEMLISDYHSKPNERTRILLFLRDLLAAVRIYNLESRSKHIIFKFLSETDNFSLETISSLIELSYYKILRDRFRR